MKKIRLSLLLCLPLLALAALSALSAQAESQNVNFDQGVTTPAALRQAAKDLAKFAADPLRAFSHLAPDRVSTMSEILSICPPEVRDEYLGSLQFKNGKLAGAHIGGLEKCMSERQIDALFLNMGIHTTDYLKGYRCSGRGTCSESQTNACTSNCRG
jgi:hypothetical protein